MEKGMEVKTVSLDMIKPSKLNPRKSFDEEKIKELAASIKEKGLVNPITLRPEAGVSLAVGPYELVCGERRWKAAKMAGLKDITAIVRKLDDKQVLELQVIENLQRADVHPLEEAEGYELLMKKHGYKTVDDLAAKVGKSTAYIYGRMKLCELLPENRKLFYEGKLTPSTALLVARIPEHLQKEAGSRIANGRWQGQGPMSYREAQKWVEEEFMLRLKEAHFDTKEKGLGGKISCAECPKRTGNQKELFSDVDSADVCTDPGCFNAKKGSFTQREVEKLKKQGKTVISIEESKKLFKYESDDSPENKYISIDESQYWDGRSRTLRPMLKTAKDVKIIYAVQPFTGKIIEMVERTDVPHILKSAGIKINRDDTSYRVPNLDKAKKENRIRAASQGLWISKVSIAKDQRCMHVIILDILLNNLGWSESEDLLEDVMKAKGCGRCWDIPKLYALGDEEVQKLIVKVISKKSEVLDDEDLEFLCEKLGFSIAKDYVITEAYLQSCTKDQLVALAKEIGLDKYLKERIKDFAPDLATKKKTELIEYFMKKGFDLKGKVPKELIK